MAHSGITHAVLIRVINLNRSRTSPKTTMEAGWKNGLRRDLRDGLKSKANRVTSNGMSSGTRSSSLLARRRMRMAMSFQKMIQTENLRNRIAINGARTMTQMRNGTKSGERYTNQDKKKSGVTSGKLT